MASSEETVTPEEVLLEAEGHAYVLSENMWKDLASRAQITLARVPDEDILLLTIGESGKSSSSDLTKKFQIKVPGKVKEKEARSLVFQCRRLGSTDNEIVCLRFSREQSSKAFKDAVTHPETAKKFGLKQSLNPADLEQVFDERGSAFQLSGDGQTWNELGKMTITLGYPSKDKSMFIILGLSRASEEESTAKVDYYRVKMRSDVKPKGPLSWVFYAMNMENGEENIMAVKLENEEASGIFVKKIRKGRRTVRVIALANDWEEPANETVASFVGSKLPTKETRRKFKNEIDDVTRPVFEWSRVNYDDFLSARKTPAPMASDHTAAMSVVWMSEMSIAGVAQMNAVYKTAKESGMRVILALPPGLETWAGMVDASVSLDDHFVFIDEEKEAEISKNKCEVQSIPLGLWLMNTLHSIFGAMKSPVLRELYNKHDLLRPHWCLSGISPLTSGFLDDCLGIGWNQRWKIGNCTTAGMSHAMFNGSNELILAKRRKGVYGGSDYGSLMRDFDQFEVHDLSLNPLKYESTTKNKAHCTVGGTQFDVFRQHGQRIPIKFEPNEMVDLEEMETALLSCLEGVTMDLPLRSVIQSCLNSGLHNIWKGKIRERGVIRDGGAIPATFAWLTCIETFVAFNVRCDMSYLPGLLTLVDDHVDWESINESWYAALIPEVFNRVENKESLFRNCLNAAGMGANKLGENALDFAIKTGESKLVEAAYSYEKQLKSQSSLEEAMAANHARWAAQSEYFVRNYLMKQTGGKGAIKALAKALSEFIRDRGDFFAVDLMGIVWHSDDETKRAVLERLMLSVKNTLDYNTVHSDKTGWMWVKEAVIGHPIWLSEWNKEEDEKKDGVLSLSLEKPILFEAVTDHCANEAGDKGGSEIAKAFDALIQSEKEEWEALTEYEPSIAQSRQLRQDQIEKGRTPSMSKEKIREIAMQFNTLDFNAEKECDSKSYMTDLLLDAHFVQPHFKKLMTQALSDFGKVQMGPVKNASRVLPKSEKYASSKKGHCHWPFTACVIDLIRCSVTVNTLSELMSALRGFELFVTEHNAELSLVRCKNGFTQFQDSDLLPSKYTDVKMNVACKDESGEYAVIGEVQFLLDCILKAKKKGHELYEVIRMKDLYRGARDRYDNEWSVTKQLTLSIDNEDRMTRLLTFFPFQLILENDDSIIPLILRSKWKNRHLMDAMAAAIVDISGVTNVTQLCNAMKKSLNDMDDMPYGICALMSAIITKAQDSDAAVTLIRTVLSDFRRKNWICGLVGLDDSIKGQIKDGCRTITEAKWHLSFELSAMEVVSVYQGWNAESKIMYSDIVKYLFYTMKYYRSEEDPTVAQALQSLIELDSAAFWAAMKSYWETHWNRRLPEYIIQVARSIQEDCPKMMQGLLERGYYSDSTKAASDAAAV